MPLADYDLTDLALFERGFPHDVFAVHRREAPVWWHRPTPHTPDGVGFWSVATHAESLEILRDPFLNEDQKKTLVHVYDSFRRENGNGDLPAPAADAVTDIDADDGAETGAAAGPPGDEA